MRKRDSTGMTYYVVERKCPTLKPLHTKVGKLVTKVDSMVGDHDATVACQCGRGVPSSG